MSGVIRNTRSIPPHGLSRRHCTRTKVFSTTTSSTRERVECATDGWMCGCVARVTVDEVMSRRTSHGDAHGVR